MTKFRIAAAAMILSALTCTDVASPVFAATAHNSQIGAAGPTADAYSTDPTAAPADDVVSVRPVKTVGRRSAPCSPGDLRTRLERKRCN